MPGFGAIIRQSEAYSQGASLDGLLALWHGPSSIE